MAKTKVIPANQGEVPMVAGEKLKPCPRCHDTKIAAYLDPHGNWRCSCPSCGFWDSMVYLSLDAAKKGWQQAGGPNPESFY